VNVFLHQFIGLISVHYRLGLLSNEVAVPKSSPLDTLSQHLSEKLAFGECFVRVF
jgi:hypothetical protein